MNEKNNRPHETALNRKNASIPSIKIPLNLPPQLPNFSDNSSSPLSSSCSSLNESRACTPLASGLPYYLPSETPEDEYLASLKINGHHIYPPQNLNPSLRLGNIVKKICRDRYKELELSMEL